MEFAYLRPPKRVNEMCHPESYMMEIKGGQPVRRIFHGVDFSEQQKQHIHELQEYLKAQGFQHSYDDVKLLKFCAAGEYNLGRSLQKIRQYEQMLRNPAIQTTSPRAMAILESGAIYSYGRDFYYRPIVIVQTKLIDLAKYSVEDYLCALNTLLKPVRDYMLVPGKVENWVVVVDCQQLPTVKPAMLTELIEKVAVAYPTALEKMYLINSSPRLLELLELMRPIIPRLTYDKIVVLDPKQSASLDRYLHAEELEKRFGGRLANLKDYWPIHSTNRIHLDETLEHIEQQPELIERAETPIQFESVINDSGFFREQWEQEERKETPKCCCSQSGCTLF